MSKVYGLIAAAGNAGRIGGIPKFLLPLKENKNLLMNSFNWLDNSGVHNYILSTNENFIPILKQLDGLDAYLNTEDIQVVKTKTMNETINLMLTSKTFSKDDIFISIMPDTYITNVNLGNEMVSLLQSKSELSAVAGLFKIKHYQKGKLGQCKIENGLIKNLIDKDPSCDYEYSWGALAWKLDYLPYIYDSDLSIGFSINRAIESGKKVGYIKSDAEYFDCGTVDEYWKLIKKLT